MLGSVVFLYILGEEQGLVDFQLVSSMTVSGTFLLEGVETRHPGWVKLVPAFKE
jgi:hypothetical protein